MKGELLSIALFALVSFWHSPEAALAGDKSDQVKTLARSEEKSRRIWSPVVRPPKAAPGKRSDAASRSDSLKDSLCPFTEYPLTAVVPLQNSIQTYSEYVSLWIFIPYGPSENHQLALEIIDRDNSFKFSIQQPSQPGIYRIQTPKSVPILKTGASYTWKLTYTCKSSTTEEQLSINGAITRVEQSNSIVLELRNAKTFEERSLVYVREGIWSEFLTELVQEKAIKEIASLWENLLTQKPEVQLKHLIYQPVFNTSLQVDFDQKIQKSVLEVH